MSETPRTNEEVRLCRVTSESFGPMVTSDFARTLELELNAVKRRAMAGCPNCDGTGGKQISETEFEQCQWCYETNTLIAETKNQTP